ncbi:MAG: hypothetical protein ACRD26_07170 [Vicinamibacterales bacterium]
MRLSRVFASLTRREPEPAPRRTAASDSSPTVTAVLLKSDRLQFVPGVAGEHTLGAAREVRERIAEILPSVTFDEEGRGAFTRTGYSVAFDTGRDDYVRAVAVEIIGGPAAVPPLARLLSKTGWRLLPQDTPTTTRVAAPEA